MYILRSHRKSTLFPPADSPKSSVTADEAAEQYGFQRVSIVHGRDYLIIGRSDKVWCGVWAYLTIELLLMGFMIISVG